MTDQSSFEVIANTPSLEDYMRLRKVAGLSSFSREAAEKGLQNTWFAVVLVTEGRTIGMGRIVGDGGCFLQIVDIAVEPAYQGQGLGKHIVSALVEHLKAHADPSAYVNLLADVPANHLYAKFGFKETAPGCLGMATSARNLS